MILMLIQYVLSFHPILECSVFFLSFQYEVNNLFCWCKVVNIFAKYRDIMIDEKMAIQKGLLPPDQADKPWKSGLITFTAFIVFGCAPLLAFIVLIPFTKNDTYKFIGACVFSAVALALLGIAKAKIASQNYALSAGITLFNGLIAGAAAYGIGWTLRNVAGLEE